MKRNFRPMIVTRDHMETMLKRQKKGFTHHFKTRLEELNKENTNLKSNILKYKVKIVKDALSNKQMVKKMDTVAELHRKESEVRKKLESENAEFMNTMKETASQACLLEREIERLKTQNLSIERENFVIQKQLDSYVEQIHTFEEEKKVYTQKMSETERKNKVLADSIRKLHAHLKKLEKENKNLKSCQKCLEKTIDNNNGKYEEELTKKDGTIHNLRRKFNTDLEKVKGRLRILKLQYKLMKNNQKQTCNQYKNYLNEMNGKFMNELDGFIGLAGKKYFKELKRRKEILHELNVLKGRIQVFVRIRPFIDIDKNLDSCVEAKSMHDVTVSMKKSNFSKNFMYKFDRVFSMNSTQKTIFKSVSGFVRNALDGINVSIFAYGQTGSGKTHTLLGDRRNQGIVGRTMKDLFRVVKERDDYEYSINLRIMEIYNESLIDLLHPSASRRECKIMLGSKDIVVKGCTKREILSIEDFEKAHSLAKRRRTTASTNSNAHSSRSHLIISLLVEGKNTLKNEPFRAKLNLIDLAGSERIKKTGSIHVKERITEAKNINSSLTALGKCMNALNKKKKHVPFRDSLLTSYLKDSLSGNSRVLMFVNINPSIDNSDETNNSLQFAARVKNIGLGTVKRNTLK